MTELLGVAAALFGSVLGGTVAAASRYAVGTVNPLGVTTLRYSIGAVCLLAFAVPAVRKFENSRQFLAAAALSLLFYALYPYLFTLSFTYTTAARGALALATMPLLTLGFAILLGREAFSWNRLAGIAIAVAGLAYALAPKLGGASSSAWKGDLIMIAAAAVQAMCNILARSFIQRMGALLFTAFGLSIGAVVLVAVSAASGVIQTLPPLETTAWAVIVYLGTVGCGLTWVIWSVAIRLANPSSVALTVTVNALTASFLGAFFLSEPVGYEFIVGLIAVSLGIAVATDLLALRRSRVQPA
ncbi:MAG TPA: DMT family transporter [Candidatus Binatia bacterium]|jgi:drug/metabolite transporter (DMT)-like permease